MNDKQKRGLNNLRLSLHHPILDFENYNQIQEKKCRNEKLSTGLYSFGLSLPKPILNFENNNQLNGKKI